MLYLLIPIAPSVNHMYFTTKKGQRILTKEAKEWISTIQELTKAEVKRSKFDKIEGKKVVIEITTYWKDNRRRDVHNGAKITFDALEGILYDDDRWVLPRYMDFHVDKENPRLELVIYEKG